MAERTYPYWSKSKINRQWRLWSCDDFGEHIKKTKAPCGRRRSTRWAPFHYLFMLPPDLLQKWQLIYFKINLYVNQWRLGGAMEWINSSHFQVCWLSGLSASVWEAFPNGEVNRVDLDNVTHVKKSSYFTLSSPWWSRRNETVPAFIIHHSYLYALLNVAASCPRDLWFILRIQTDVL